MRSIFGWMDMWNKQNCRIWDDTNPREIHQLQMHPEKVTVWCGFWSGGIIGPYFFQNEAGVAITVYGERYRSMISNFLWPKIDDMDTDVISTGWRYVPHTAYHDGHSIRAIWDYLARRRCELATEIVQFNAFRLLPLGLS